MTKTKDMHCKSWYINWTSKQSSSINKIIDPIKYCNSGCSSSNSGDNILIETSTTQRVAKIVVTVCKGNSLSNRA